MHEQDRRGIAAFFTVAFFCACLTAAAPSIGRAEDASEDFSVKMLCRGPETLILHMRFIGSNPKPRIVHLLERTDPFNPAFGNSAGNDPLQWRAGGIRSRIPVSARKTGGSYELVAGHYDHTVDLVIPTTSVPLSMATHTVASLD